MKKLAGILGTGLLSFQMLFAAQTIPDIKQISGKFGPQDGWGMEELSILNYDVNNILYALAARHRPIYSDLPKKLAGVTMDMGDYSIIGVSEKEIHFICTKENPTITYINLPYPFTDQAFETTLMPNGYSATIFLTDKADLDSLHLQWRDTVGTTQNYSLKVSYEGNKATLLNINGEIIDSVHYLPNGAIDTYGGMKYSYNEEGRLAKIENTTLKSIFEWEELPNGDLSKKESIYSLIEDGFQHIYDIEMHYNDSNSFTFWSAISSDTSNGSKGLLIYNADGNPNNETVELIDSLGNWTQRLLIKYEYNEFNDLQTETRYDNSGSGTTVTITRYEYNENRWPIRIIRENSLSGGETQKDTTTITYSGLPILPKKQSLSPSEIVISHKAGRLLLSSSFPKASKITLYSVNGREIYSVYRKSEAVLALPATIAKGVYLWRAEAADKVYSGSVTLK